MKNGIPDWMDSEAGKSLQATLSKEDNLHAMSRMIDRMDTLEQAVEKLTGLLEQGPGMLSMVTDMADETYQKAKENGIDVEKRLGNALELAEKLTSPEMMTKLDSLFGIMDQLPGMLSMVTDIVDESHIRAAENGVDLEARLGMALKMAEKLTNPEMEAKLEGVMQLADQAPGLGAMAIDIFDETMAQSVDSGQDVLAMFSPDTLSTLGGLAVALKESKAQPVKKMSLWGMYRASKDPNFQKALGFIVELGKNFGKKV